MSYEELSFRQINKSRKSYSCEWCNTTIAIGEPHKYRAYKFHGDFITGRLHLECNEAMADSDPDLLMEGFLPGDSNKGQPLR